MKFELEVVENKILPVLDISLKDTPTQWWGTHKENINNWYQCKRLMRNRFGTKQENRYMEKYDGIWKSREHVDKCIIKWILVPPEEWPHHFIHTLEGIPRNWYTELEQHGETANWEEMQLNFVVTFSFEHESQEIHIEMKVVRYGIFEEP
jgi:hypothetical protein